MDLESSSEMGMNDIEQEEEIIKCNVKVNLSKKNSTKTMRTHLERYHPE